MQHINGNRLPYSPFIVLAGVILVSAWFLLTAQREPPEVGTLRITSDQAAEVGLSLTAVDSSVRPTIDQDTAELVARGNAPPGATTVQGAFFGRVQDATIDKPMWVIAMDPKGLLVPLTNAPVEFMLVLVDSDTGEFVRTIMKGEPPAGEPITGGGLPVARPLSAPYQVRATAHELGPRKH